MSDTVTQDTSSPDVVNSQNGEDEGDVVGATGLTFEEQLARFEATYDRITAEAREFQVLTADLKNIKKVADGQIS